MKSWYEQKEEFHKKQRQLAHDAGKDKSAAHHKAEMLNYREMANQVKG